MPVAAWKDLQSSVNIIKVEMERPAIECTMMRFYNLSSDGNFIQDLITKLKNQVKVTNL